MLSRSPWRPGAALVLAACSARPAATPTATPTATATSTPTPTPTSTPTSSATPATPTEFPKWTTYSGPKGKFPLPAEYAQPGGDHALSLWVVRPGGVAWDRSLTFTRADYVGADGDDDVVTTHIFPEQGFPGEAKLTVPGALVCATSAKTKLAKGDVVLMAMAATTSDYARVVGPDKSNEDGSVRVLTHWVSTQEETALPEQLLKIEDKPTCGQRVYYKNAAGDELRWMQLIRVVGDEAWGLGMPEGQYDVVLIAVPAKDVTPMPMTKTYAPKAKVMVATANHTLVPAEIVSVADGGLAYAIHASEGMQDWTADFEDVIDVPKGWPKR